MQNHESESQLIYLQYNSCTYDLGITEGKEEKDGKSQNKK